MATDDVRLGRAIYCVVSALTMMLASQPEYTAHVRELADKELTKARNHLAAVDRGKLADTELKEEAP